MSYPLSLPTGKPLVTLTNPKPSLWVIELHNGDDSRLTATLIDRGLRPALDVVEKHWREGWRVSRDLKDKKSGAGALIIVGNTRQDKFFSNGLDYASASADTNFFPRTYNPLLERLITFPIPVIAAINGHAFAGAFIIALACDYRVMSDGSARNAWLCMNEVQFGAPWPQSVAAIARAKVGNALVRRSIALEAHRFTPAEALAAGLVDRLTPGGTAGVLAAVGELAETVARSATEGVWGLIKADLYRNELEVIKLDLRSVMPDVADRAAKARL